MLNNQNIDAMSFKRAKSNVVGLEQGNPSNNNEEEIEDANSI